MQKLISPQDYSYKREIVIRKGSEVLLDTLKISDSDEVIMIFNISNKKVNVTYNSVYDALEDGWDLNNDEIKKYIKGKYNYE